MRDLVPVAEFAASLGRSTRSIYDARYRGSDLPPAIAIGGRLYFYGTDIDDWIGQKREAAQAEANARRQAVTRISDRTRPSSSRQMQTNRGPRADKHAGPSLNTPRSKVVSYE